MSTPMIPALPGYTDLHLIANGSTALVFRATQERLNRMVAVKVLLIDDLMTTEATVAQELKTTVALSSQPHIVSIIDTGTTTDGNPYIVMEYCEGGSYAQILKRQGPLAVPEVLEVGMKIGEALHAAHLAGIVHRDVKPPNILRSQFGPALADFGIARAPDALAGTLTMGKLTPHHASPEAFLLEAQNGSSDLYSLASTMWNLLAGRPPFAEPGASTDPMAFRDRVLNQPVPRLPREDVPEWLQIELAQAMAKNPADRHTSAMAFAEALRRHSYAMNVTAASATHESSTAVAKAAARADLAAERSPFAPPEPAPDSSPVTASAPDTAPEPPARFTPPQPGGTPPAPPSPPRARAVRHAPPGVHAGGPTEWPTWPRAAEHPDPAPRGWEPVPEWQQQHTALAGETPITAEPEPAHPSNVGPTGFTAAPLGPPQISPTTPSRPAPPPAASPIGPGGPATRASTPTHGVSAPVPEPRAAQPPPSFSRQPSRPDSDSARWEAARPTETYPAIGSAQPAEWSPVAPAHQPSLPTEGNVPRQTTRSTGRTKLIAGLAGLALVLVASIVAGIVKLAGAGGEQTPTDTVAVLRQGAPTHVALTDSVDGTSVSLSWVDNSDGKASTVITVRRSGETSPALQPVTVEPGHTRHDINGGLNARYDYCFLVASLYPGPKIAAAPEVCTAR